MEAPRGWTRAGAHPHGVQWDYRGGVLESQELGSPSLGSGDPQGFAQRGGTAMGTTGLRSCCAHLPGDTAVLGHGHGHGCFKPSFRSSPGPFSCPGTAGGFGEGTMPGPGTCRRGAAAATARSEALTGSLFRCTCNPHAP